ncbi:MAG: ACT domain-containing protein, partial [Moraxellaceae bacterium]|nr:ACT domain-containing protein [Moraxellaceae bacterium]
IERIWDELGDDYFLRESAKDIAWHTAAILQHRNQSEPLVLMRESHTEPYEGAGQIFVYTKDMPNLFAATVAALDQLSLTVLDARIITSASQFSLDTYIVLDQSGERITERERLNYIVNELRHSLADPDNFPDIVHRRLPRQLKHFEIRTEVSLSNDITNQRTAVEIITLDRPGLLARIGRIFMDENLTLQTARIATLGERAEDVFFVTDAAGQPLSDLTQCQHLIQTLRDQLDQNDA